MKDNTRWFQWIVGERRGEVVVFDRVEEEDGIIYIGFKDGSRLNEEFIAQINQTDMTGKMMAEIDGPLNIWKFDEKIIGEETGRVETDWDSQVKYEIPTMTEIMSDGQKLPTRKKVTTLIPPKRTPPSHSVFGAIKRSIEQSVQQPQPQFVSPPVYGNPIPIDASDPVYIVMSKSKKVDTEIQMNMTVALPPQAIYDMVKESFENGDQKLVEYIIENITVNEIKEALKASISSMYEQTKDGFTP